MGQKGALFGQKTSFSTPFLFTEPFSKDKQTQIWRQKKEHFMVRKRIFQIQLGFLVLSTENQKVLLINFGNINVVFWTSAIFTS